MLYRTRYAPYLFVAPFLLIFAIFGLYPLINSLVLAFYITAGPNERVFVGLGNFAFLLRDRDFWTAVINTASFAMASVFLQLPLSLGLAMLLNRSQLWGRNVFRFAFFSPHLMGTVFAALLFSLLLAPRFGLLNQALYHWPEVVGWLVPWLAGVLGITAGFRLMLVWRWRQSGRAIAPVEPGEPGVSGVAGPQRRHPSLWLPVLTLVMCLGVILVLWLTPLMAWAAWNLDRPPIDTRWLGDSGLVLPAIVLTSLWLHVGYNMIYFLAALQAVDKELYEASWVDGANKFQQFIHITLPGIRHVAVFVIVFSTIGSFQIFELPYLLLNKSTGPDSSGLFIVTYLYQNGFVTGDLGYASAIGWTLAVAVMAIAVSQIVLSGTFNKD